MGRLLAEVLERTAGTEPLKPRFLCFLPCFPLSPQLWRSLLRNLGTAREKWASPVGMCAARNGRQSLTPSRFPPTLWEGSRLSTSFARGGHPCCCEKLNVGGVALGRQATLASSFLSPPDSSLPCSKDMLTSPPGSLDFHKVSLSRRVSWSLPSLPSPGFTPPSSAPLWPVEIEEICIFLGSAALTEVLFVNFQIHRWVRNLLGSLMECAEALLFPYGCLLSCLKRERADFPGGPVAETELPMQVDWVWSLVREVDPTCHN